MRNDRLFQNADAQEQEYAPDQLPAGQQRARVDVDDRSPTPSLQPGDDSTPTAVPVLGGTAATPPSQEFDPGMEREERDSARGDAGYIGPDPRDERGR
jgi:hypothetical protein